MIEPTKKLLRDPGSELLFGLVAPIGADLERLEADAAASSSCPKTGNARERSRPSDTRHYDVVRPTA
jgi:hypothetical protein